MSACACHRVFVCGPGQIRNTIVGWANSVEDPRDANVIAFTERIARIVENGVGGRGGRVCVGALYLKVPSFSPQEKEGVDAVSAGAILSDYQRVRVENV